MAVSSFYWDSQTLLDSTLSFQHLFQRMGPHGATPLSSENSSELSQPLHVFLGAAALMDESVLSGWRCSWNQTQALQREIQRSSCTLLLHRKHLNKVKCNTLPLSMLITHFSGEPQSWVGIKSPLSKSSSCIFSSSERKLDSFKTSSQADFGVRTAAGK